MIQQLLTVSSGIPIGAFIEGGYFAGYISTNANGIATHGLIVCPNPDGNNSGTTLQWKTSNTTSNNAYSRYDGSTNTFHLANSQHPAANYCAGLTTNGYSDWYLPAIYELDIAYANLRPTNTPPYYGIPGPQALSFNNFAVPQRTTQYTTGQTSVTVFQSGGAQAFASGWHWTSSETESNPDDPDDAWHLNMDNGVLDAGGSTGFVKTNSLNVRAFRRFAV